MKELWAKIAKDLAEFILYAMENHPGKFFGALAGFLLGLMIIIIGFWQTLLLMALVAIGIFVGKHWDEDKNFWQWLNRL